MKPHEMTFGKYRGMPVTEVPVDYLLWVVRTASAERNNFAGYKAIQEELIRRAPKTARKVLKIEQPKTVTLSITEHALQRARQRLYRVYKAKCRLKESVKAWLLRVFVGVLKFGECRASFTERNGRTFKTPRYEYFYKDSIEGLEWLFVTAGTESSQTLVTVYSQKIKSSNKQEIAQ